MPTKKWILPEGIEDILPEQAYWLELKRREVIETFLSYGYGLVIPPLIEYHDSLLSNASEDFPLPDNPVITTSFSLGIFKLTFFRLWTLAP